MEIRNSIFLIFLGSALFIYFRGKVRFGLLRALTDYVVLLAPINTLIYLFSKVGRSPYLPVNEFPELQPLKDRWHIIRDEALALQDKGQIRQATGYNDIGFNSFFRTGWKHFYLYWYGKDLPSAEESYPQTVALLLSGYFTPK